MGPLLGSIWCQNQILQQKLQIEKNEAEKLKFYYYEFFVSRIEAAPFRGSGSSIKKSASDTGNDGMAYRIYGCGIRNGVGLEPMVVPLESVMVLPK